MTPSTTRRLAAAAVTAVLAVPAAALPASAQSTDASDSVGYVALGDSYAAGNGATQPLTGDPVDEECRRTGNGYADRLTASLAGSSGRSVALDLEACSGATTLSTRTGVDPAPGLTGEPRDVTGPDQLAAVGPDTDLVTVTAGANDTDFTAVLQVCLVDPAGCEAAVAAGVALYDGQELIDLLLAVDAAATADRDVPATVLVTGYPQLFDPAGVAARQCGLFTLAPATAAQAETINAGTVQLNSLLQVATSEAAGLVDNVTVQFVDIDEALAGNRICSTDTWLNPPSLFVPFARWFHPTDAGHQAYADVLATAATDAGVDLPVLAADRDPDLSPILECVVDNADGTLTAWFGYENRETADPAAYVVPEGQLNQLVGPVTATDGPVTAFRQPDVVADRPGRTPFDEPAFTATFPDGERVVWSLHGRTTTASVDSSRCPSS